VDDVLTRTIREDSALFRARASAAAVTHQEIHIRISESICAFNVPDTNK
jgi:hypothetical protein